MAPRSGANLDAPCVCWPPNPANAPDGARVLLELAAFAEAVAAALQAPAAAQIESWLI
jgi:hypothetical protein